MGALPGAKTLPALAQVPCAGAGDATCGAMAGASVRQGGTARVVVAAAPTRVVARETEGYRFASAVAGRVPVATTDVVVDVIQTAIPNRMTHVDCVGLSTDVLR